MYFNIVFYTYFEMTNGGITLHLTLNKQLLSWIV